MNTINMLEFLSMAPEIAGPLLEGAGIAEAHGFGPRSGRSLLCYGLLIFQWAGLGAPPRPCRTQPGLVAAGESQRLRGAKPGAP
jgi:hypothetical protein